MIFTYVFFIHTFTHTLKTSKWISRIFLKNHRIFIKWRYFSKFIKQEPSVSNNEQSSHASCLRNVCWWSKHISVGYVAPIKGRILTGKQDLCRELYCFFFFLFFLTSYLKDMKETFLPLIVLLIFFLNLKFSFTHFNF